MHRREVDNPRLKAPGHAGPFDFFAFCERIRFYPTHDFCVRTPCLVSVLAECPRKLFSLHNKYTTERRAKTAKSRLKPRCFPIKSVKPPTGGGRGIPHGFRKSLPGGDAPGKVRHRHRKAGPVRGRVKAGWIRPRARRLFVRRLFHNIRRKQRPFRVVFLFLLSYMC